MLEELATVVSPRVLESPKRLDEERRELEDYFEGSRENFDVPVDWSLTSPGFRSRALHAVARIPYGKTKTYSEVAKSAGNPRAFRAAGTACGHNPVPLIVPCHRVVQSGGGIGNYGGGPEMKRGAARTSRARSAAQAGNTAIVAVKPCRKLRPPTGPISPAQKKPAVGRAQRVLERAPRRGRAPRTCGSRGRCR